MNLLCRPEQNIYIYDVIDKKKGLVWSPRQYYAIITQSMVYFFNSSELVFEINLRTLSPKAIANVEIRPVSVLKKGFVYSCY